jgi:hypothetical protein
LLLLLSLEEQKNDEENKNNSKPTITLLRRDRTEEARALINTVVCGSNKEY